MKENKLQTDFPDLIKHFEFRKDKASFNLQAFIFLQVINLSYSAGIAYVLYCTYDGIVNFNLLELLIVAVLCVYTILYCKKSEFFCFLMQKNGIYKWFKSYTIYSEEPVDQEGVLFPWMPHNILAVPLIIKNSIKEKNPLYNAVIMGSRAALNLPLIGTFSKWSGIYGVDAKQFKQFMKEKANMIFVPGGFEEATIISHREYRIYADRFGFIKYALQYGYNISPIIVFNENKGYVTSDKFLKLRLIINKLKFPACLFFSKYFILPDHNVDIVVLIGSKLKFPKIQNPTKEDVEQYHKIYTQKVRDTFEAHKEKFDAGSQLTFFSQDPNYQKM
ncbi:hypothetical protein PPERSA_06771 [Pseudocohnilembus persalinus]|uniref:Acyltransferase n=1 Tax=Pseudocohnilembus persalinus TaxID=266149 RepID=A0A0V0QSH6_PSEPJ|nr:hypothetical protein PPERSA_06771 [Pseudocohnilembus persalinus]|eukprot:KRX05137.1 hypothetical protein PPERSA_06771 [Pseudocohnilembus persalinus]